MSGKQILIKGGKNWFEFSKSKTGQLDYAGKIADVEIENLDGFQKIESSAYFSPGYYIYLQDELNCSPEIYVSPETDISDSDTYEFLLHIGALICAVEAKNAFLAVDLCVRRRKSFEKFAQLTRFIMKPLAAEIFFCLVYRRFNNICDDEVPFVFSDVQKLLGFDPAEETPEQAFVRYFKKNKAVLTLPVVGTNHYRWSPYSDVFENLSQNVTPDNFESQLKKLASAKRSTYANLSAAVQAEPYNPADKNAIAVRIENIDSKLEGNPVLEKAGYLRASAAKILRSAKPEKMTFSAKLVQISERDIVLQIEV